MKRLTASGEAARDAFGRISSGSRILTDRITSGAGEWVRAGRREDLEGVAAALGCWLRAGLLAGGAWIAYRVLHAAPNLMWAATAVWCWKAYRAKPAAPAAADDAEPADGDGQEPPSQGPRVDLSKAGPPSPEQLVQALRQVAAPHAHLAALARHLDTTPGRVREGLDAAGIPVSGGVRAGGRVSTGVKREDFPTLPTAPGPPVVAPECAGQPGNNNSNNAEPAPGGVTVEHPVPGMTIVRHHADTVLRHHRVQRP
ncbi:hypothetical protein RM572_21885 [Streptomyces sp. DSM 42041]|uniref:Uncharacterized protein n=1 Tax=Streptomyces hazeniae TaxID=3075538 RepID=A0ABU2NYX8_9ACTN|nr:hypothetical protein [Streptomyces sp. DSM 42041]MDT0381413.1 hypothetical protein [Streptomyces sp. DSM 42041]